MLIRSLLLGALAIAGSCGGSPEPTGSVAHVTPDTVTTPITQYPPGPTGWVKSTLSGAGVTSAYQVFVPLNYDPAKKWPVILFQHSSTERGTDNNLQLTLGLGPVVKAQEATWQAITIFPQISLNESARGAYIRIGMASLDSVTLHYNVDPARIYVTGISAGGVYSFEMLHLNPTRFAAFVPMAANTCAGCITGDAASTQADAALLLAHQMPTMGYWQFQGDQDGSIPVADARAISSAWKTVNPAARYTEYAGVTHGQTHLHAYAEPTLIPWLLAQHK